MSRKLLLARGAELRENKNTASGYAGLAADGKFDSGLLQTITSSDLPFLSNVDNTSDANKPVSTAMQAALDSKVNTSLTLNDKALTGNISLNKADIGLSNVDNTSDANKPVSTATQTALDGKVSTTRTINGQALTSDISLMLTKTDVGLGNVDNTSDANKPVSSATQTALNAKVNTSLTVNAKALTSNIVLDKTDIGLSNVENTSDANKPISTATQTALDAKVNTSLTVNAKALTGNISLTKADIGLSNVDNTSDANKPVSTATQTALDAKVNTSLTVNAKALTGNISLTKADIGLSNVDNTSDANKPVPTAMQTALDGKESSANKNVANGYAGLNASTKLLTAHMPIDMTFMNMCNTLQFNTNFGKFTKNVTTEVTIPFEAPVTSNYFINPNSLATISNGILSIAIGTVPRFIVGHISISTSGVNTWEYAAYTTRVYINNNLYSTKSSTMAGAQTYTKHPIQWYPNGWQAWPNMSVIEYESFSLRVTMQFTLQSTINDASMAVSMKII